MSADAADAPAGSKAASIALGVTGSIAAYKAVELLRLLTAEGADVVVLLSPSATRFVGPLSFAALSRHPVETDVLDLLPDGRIGHIVVADSADAIVVAPATAHWLAAMANGLAGDVVTAAALATSAPVVVAPGDGRRHVDASRDRRPTSPGSATASATRSSRRRAGRSRPGQSGVGPARRAAGDRRRGRRGRRRPTDPPAGRGRAPAARRRPCRARPISSGRRIVDHRRRHARADRSGSLHRQPLDRARWASRSPRRRSPAAPR